MIAKGQKISDRYQIIKSIGEGGMANVYLAYDTILERNVAVKVLRGDLANDEKFVRRFQREALQASSLSHPNIVEVYDVGEDNGEYYIVMEYVEGKHLKGLLKKRGKLTIREVVDIMIQVTSGLTVAHDSYIIHRDIKPQNIMILDNGLVKLTDFGIALAMNSTQLTQTNSVMGSVHYLPPEGASGKGATLQSDIYPLLKKYKPDHFAGGPIHYENLVSHHENDPLIYGKNFVSGGASLPKSTEKKLNQINEDGTFDEKNIFVRQGLGCTENGGASTYAKKGAYKPYGVGIPLLYETVGIFKPGTDVELGFNTDGEICINGSTVMKEYFNNEEETNKVLKDGWFYTGDLAYKDKDGFIFLTGRQKDMIVLKNGKKVFPEELEILINRLDEVEECFVYGLPDAQDSNDVKVSVEVVYNETVTKSKYPNATEQELKDIIWNEIKEINKTLPMYKYIKHLVLTKEPLIKTTTNKIKRNEELKKIIEFGG